MVPREFHGSIAGPLVEALIVIFFIDDPLTPDFIQELADFT
jgi:hypothetical protein